MSSRNLRRLWTAQNDAEHGELASHGRGKICKLE